MNVHIVFVGATLLCEFSCAGTRSNVLIGCREMSNNKDSSTSTDLVVADMEKNMTVVVKVRFAWNPSEA